MEPTPAPPALAALVPDAVRDAMVALRHDLHRHPELSSQEHRTAAALEAALAPLAPVSVTRVAGTGVVARLRGRTPLAPVVAVRGDIDALPIHEATGLPWASVHPGVMHACGHDVHAAWAVGAAHLLAAEPAVGDVLVVLQPAEETGDGAVRVLASGALEGLTSQRRGQLLPPSSLAWQRLPELRLASMNLAELRQLAAEQRLGGYGRLTRDGLSTRLLRRLGRRKAL